MASVNKVILVGNLGRDPEVRYMPSGDAMVNLSLATTDTWKDKNGDRQEKTEWHRVVMFGRLAEIAGEYLKKGSQAYIEGRFRLVNGPIKRGKTNTLPRSLVTECKCLEDVTPVGGSLADPQRNLSLKMEEGFLEGSTT